MRRAMPVVVGSLLVASIGVPPASAAFAAVVDVPATPVYSPYAGPTDVTFTFEPGDPATIFTLRIRPVGHRALKERDVLVDPGSATSPLIVPFGWKAAAVAEPTDFVVDVRRQDSGSVITRSTFTLLPHLVSDVSASPSPFYPLLQDGYRDRTKIGFSLAADTDATSIHIFRPDAYGRCCGAQVRGVDLGARSAGRHAWRWDGTDDATAQVAKGTYFVKVNGTDTDGVQAGSRATKVEVATGVIRRTAEKHEAGSAYEATTDERATAIGGDCMVGRDETTREARILCANANITVVWKWHLRSGERIEAVSFTIDGGYYGCHFTKSKGTSRSFLHVTSPPTSSCNVSAATITFSYPVKV